SRLVASAKRKPSGHEPRGASRCSIGLLSCKNRSPRRPHTKKQAMDIDQYAFCPCGSGKKFKWCCQNIYRDIERAYEQLEQGQVEVALRIMSEVTKKNPDNPEVWGKQAQVFFYTGQKEQGEESLEHALKLNPGYPFGLLLQARLRA